MPGESRAALRTRLEHWLVRGWARRGLVYWLFLDLAWLFGWLARRRRARFLAGRFGTARVGKPVVVVGNLIAGGTGKTPIVIALVEALRARGRRPGVIARGYGGRNLGAPQAATPEADPARVGDEPVLIAMRTGAPVRVARDRVAAARALLADHPEVDVLVSDDGLQHYALARDVELVVFDAHGAGNGAFLPAGPLREPVDRPRDATLFSAGPVVPALTAGAPAFSATLVVDLLYPLGRPGQGAAASTLAGQAVAAYAGIAHPDKFFESLRALGATVEAHPLPDHAEFAAGSFSDTRSPLIVITEKDAVKCARVPALATDERIRVARAQLHLDPALIDLVMEKLDGPQAA